MKQRSTTVTLPATKPRNPIALAARQRQAGRHATGRSAERQSQARALRAELTASSPPRDP